MAVQSDVVTRLALIAAASVAPGPRFDFSGLADLFAPEDAAPRPAPVTAAARSGAAERWTLAG